MSASQFARKLILSSFLLIFAISAHSQNVNDPVSFSNQALLMGSHSPATDPISGVMPATAYGTGFGAFLDNPASIALLGKNFGEFSFAFNQVDEDATFLGNTRSLNDNQFNISGAGFIYNFPTVAGRFVIGAGYNQNNVFNRAVAFNAQNNNSSITDQFKLPGSTYNDIAYETFATDYGDEFEDWDESIFRAGFAQPGDFLGIRQQGEFYQTGQSGEYSAFFATEFQRNLMFGASVSILSGRLNHDRIIQEIDDENRYNDTFIDSNGDGTGDTDIDNIIFSEEIKNRYYGFRARAGVLYQVTPNVNIGLSYTLPTRLNIEEDFDGRIISTFNNGVQFEDSEGGRFSYSVTYPAQTSLGFAITDVAGFSLSASAEYVNYANMRVNFDDDALFEDQQLENDFISENFADGVISYRAGLQYNFNPLFSLRAGYGYQPSKFRNGNDDRNIYSVGAGFSLSRDTSIEIGARYTTWKETSALYTFGEYDYSVLPDSAPPATIRSEDVLRNAGVLQVMATLRINMY